MVSLVRGQLNLVLKSATIIALIFTALVGIRIVLPFEEDAKQWSLFLLNNSNLEIPWQKTPSKPDLGTISNITILKESDFPEINPEVCRRTPVLSVGNISRHFMMCVKPVAVDKFVSGAILNSGMWESGMVQTILKWLDIYRGNVTFLDLGANIGMFSVAASAFGHRVIAVDPIKTNLAYVHHSVSLSGSQGKVTYFHNSVNNVPTVLYPFNRDPTNEGGMFLVSEQDSANKPPNQIGIPIQSITFEEILEVVPTQTAILKIDVEGYECKALGEYMAATKKTRYIPYIMMEWEIIGSNMLNTCPQIQTFLQDFLSSGYSPFSESLQALDPKAKLPTNVLWIHKDALRGK